MTSQTLPVIRVPSSTPTWMYAARPLKYAKYTAEVAMTTTTVKKVASPGRLPMAVRHTRS